MLHSPNKLQRPLTGLGHALLAETLIALLLLAAGLFLTPEGLAEAGQPVELLTKTEAPRIPQVTPTPPVALEQQTVDLINQRRLAMDLEALQVDARLTAAARRHSNDIGPHGLCQHEGTDGSTPWERIAQAGYTGFGNGEVVGCGYRTPQAVVEAWWNSPGHYDILTNPASDDIGCGWWLNTNGNGWQTCVTGISNRPTSTRTPTVTSATSTATLTAVPPSQTRTPTRTATNTPTRTSTQTQTRTPTHTSTYTPTRTPTRTSTSIVVGHVIWQSRPDQPHALQQLPVTLTLKLNIVEVNYPAQNTDANGFFTVSVAGLAGGNYTWRAKGPQFLANGGSVTLNGAPVTSVEMGPLRTGDANNDNIVSTGDFNVLKSTFGRIIGQPGYDARADFNGDEVVNLVDFNWLKSNFGAAGAPPP